jgi:5,10-methylene-tetrahydrofolate dehydrogenase/methenyl tetrahydrofolate cyclohydrolase
MESPGASQTNVIVTKGIFTGLPTFPPHLSGFSAIVVGASGISGQHMLHVLSQSPKRWSKIYALSRSLPHIPDNADNRIIHVPVDLLKGPEEIAAALRAAQVKA